MRDDVEDARADDGPGAILRAALHALPTEIPPPTETWSRVERAFVAQRERDESTALRFRQRVKRRTFSVAALGAAALLAIMIGVLTRRANVPVPASELSSLLQEERADPRVHAVLDQRRNWHAALGDSLRSSRWPQPARNSVDAALATTDEALAVARVALIRDPANGEAREALAALRARQLSILQRAFTLLDEI
jgi:hypothetical protein